MNRMTDSVHHTRQGTTVYEGKGVTLAVAPDGPRRCGGCTLCCTLLPVRELNKLAGKRCQHQRTGKGCAVHHQKTMPRSCFVWNCRWLGNPAETAELRRPDRSHCVIDIMPSFITLRTNDGSTPDRNVEVVQIWVHPNYPDAWKAPTMRAYIEARGAEGVATIIRYSATRAITVFPPSMASDHQWHEFDRGELRPEHTPAELLAGLRSAQKVTVQS